MINRWKVPLASAFIACLACACSSDDSKPAKEQAMSIQLMSSAVVEGQPIPREYTCDGRDVSPPLKWSGAPMNTRSFALIADDPDAPAGTWVHWVLFNVPAATTELAEGVANVPQLPNGARQGLNDFRRLGYGGPCPPPGKTHRYFFKLHALDQHLDLKPGATKGDLLKAMKGHILAEGQLMGSYQRK